VLPDLNCRSFSNTLLSKEIPKMDLTGYQDAVHTFFSYFDSLRNSFGKALSGNIMYYRVGTSGQEVNLFLGNITSGNMQVIEDMGTFEAPKYYYRPVPQTQVALNPDLKQIFGWE
jgi:hypothetical protein